MVNGKIAVQSDSTESIGSEDLTTLKCYCLPSLKSAVVTSLSKKPPPLQVLGLRTETDYRNYWWEVVSLKFLSVSVLF